MCARALSQYGKAPLHLAAKYNHAEVATVLLQAGADLRAKNKVRKPHLAFSLA